MDLNALWQETLASTLTTTAQDGATAFGLHACTEAELAFARALGRLVGALHVLKIFWNLLESFGIGSERMDAGGCGVNG